MSATLTAVTLSYVFESLKLRNGHTQLYKLSIDRPNICHFVGAIPKPEHGATEYAPLNFLVPQAGPLGLWPKSMVFVDSIMEILRITEYLRSLAAARLCGTDVEEVVRPYYATLETATRDMFMDSLIGGYTRVLVCTDAAGMGVNIPDIKIIVQWKLAGQLTIATLWQRIGRAGRDQSLRAISVIFVEERHILPSNVEGSDFEKYGMRVELESEIAVRDFVRTMYAGRNSHKKERAPSAYHIIDPAVLFYVNTRGCHCRAIMALFEDGTAFAAQRYRNCCDNTIYSAPTDSTVPLQWSLHGVAACVSIRYTETRHYADQLVEDEMARMRLVPMNNTSLIKPNANQLAAVRRSLDTWAIQQWPRSHRVKLPVTARQDLAKKCGEIHTIADLEEVLHPKLSLRRHKFRHTICYA